MSIEIRAPVAPSNPTGKTAADAGRNRAPGAQGEGEAPAVSFLSLLGTIGDGQPNTVAAAAGTMGGDAPPPDTDLAGAARQTGGVALANDALQAVVPAQPGLASAQMPVPADGSSVALPGTGRPAAGGKWTGVQGGGTDSGQQKPGEPTPLSAQSVGFKDTHALQQAAADGVQGPLDKPALLPSSRDFMARVEAARTAAETVATAPPAGSLAGTGGLSAAPQIASMFDVSAAGLRVGGGPLRNQDRVQGRPGAPGVSPGFVAWGDAAPAGTNHGASAVYAPGAMTPAPATAMAEKMHYWVSRGVQSAELQLDAFAGGTVDVSIAVKGDSAVVEFRTDQPQARQMLLDAMPQLKELLAGEGLMLSGGFVGGSGQQDAQSRNPNGPAPGGRSGTLAATPELAAGRLTPARATAGNSIDLFV